MPTGGILSSSGGSTPFDSEHGDLLGLGNDDHTQYGLLAGRSGGQTFTGGTDALDSLTLKPNDQADSGVVDFDLSAKGKIAFDTSSNDGIAKYTLEVDPLLTGTGTLSTSASSSSVTGVATKFLSELSPGDILTYSVFTRTVLSINSDTSLTLTSTAGITGSHSFTIVPSILRIQDNAGNSLMYMNGQGKLMIGTKIIGTNDLSPSALLDVRGNAVFNEDGNDNDFRIESDTRTHMFFVDASTNRIGINNSTPTGTLHIAEANTTQSAVVIDHAVNADVFTINKNAGVGKLINFNSTNSQNVPTLDIDITSTGTFLQNTPVRIGEFTATVKVDIPFVVGAEMRGTLTRTTVGSNANLAFGYRATAENAITGLAYAGAVGRHTIGDRNLEGLRILIDDNQTADIINCIDDTETNSFFRVDNQGSVITVANVQTKAGSPAQITSNQNDYNFGTQSFIRLSTDASRTLTGLANGVDGRHIYVANVGSNDLVLANQNASSAAGNRIITGTGADLTLTADQTATLIYDNTTLRWRVFN